MKAKLLTLLHRLRVTWNKGVKKLVMHIDSKVVIMKMRFPLKPSQAHYHVIKERQNLLNSAK